VRHVLVCYDICCPTRLRRVHRVVRDFGLPMQYSVFACRLTDRDRAELEARLLGEIDQREDQVMLVDLGPAADGDRAVPGTRVLGRPKQRALAAVVVVGPADRPWRPAA
jgi:CRISPR-associated protein Cas2